MISAQIGGLSRHSYTSSLSRRRRILHPSLASSSSSSSHPAGGGGDDDDVRVNAGASSSSSSSDSFALTLPSPAVLLNAMAERYTTTSRILLEFVDNALDDAEALFAPDDDIEPANSGTYEGGYARDVRINVQFLGGGDVRISDNCRGMRRSDLTKVVLSVGQSAKKGAPSFLNGQFGFGMQSFRAACETLRVISRHADDEAPTPFAIDVCRSRTDGFRVEAFEETGVRNLDETGTTVELRDWDEQAMDTSALDMAQEVELHFERLLARRLLTVTVEDHSTDPPTVHRCQPTTPDEEDVLARVQVGFDWPPDADAAKRQHVDADLYVLRHPREGHRLPRFFVQGRRISEVGSTKSFTDLTRKRWSVWNHPCVGGYISITGDREGALQPVITRDEFKRTRGRKACFTELLSRTEERLEEALEQINERNSDASMSKLEGVLSACLQGVTRSELRTAASKSDAASATAVAAMTQIADGGSRHVPMPQEDGGEISGSVVEKFVPSMMPITPLAASATAEVASADADANDSELNDVDQNGATDASGTAKSPPRRGSLSAPSFDVRLVRSIPGHSVGSDGPRSSTSGSIIYVSTTHPDFKERLRTSRGGREKFDERLIGYLAAVVSAGYRERLMSEIVAQGAENNNAAFSDLVGTFCTLEERLRRALPVLLKELEAQQQADAASGGSSNNAALDALRRRKYRDRL